MSTSASKNENLYVTLLIRLSQESKTEPGMYFEGIVNLTEKIHTSILFCRRHRKMEAISALQDASRQVELLLSEVYDTFSSVESDCSFRNTAFIMARCKTLQANPSYDDDALIRILGELISSRNELAGIYAKVYPEADALNRAAQESKRLPHHRTALMIEGPTSRSPHLYCYEEDHLECELTCHTLLVVREHYYDYMTFAWHNVSEETLDCTILANFYENTRQSFINAVQFVRDCVRIEEMQCDCLQDAKICSHLKDAELTKKEGESRLHLLSTQMKPSPKAFEGIEEIYLIYCESYEVVEEFILCFLQTMIELRRTKGRAKKRKIEAKQVSHSRPPKFNVPFARKNGPRRADIILPFQYRDKEVK